MSGIHVYRGGRVACLSALVNPLLVFVGHLPGAVGVYSRSADIEGRRRRLVPDFDVQLVPACRKPEGTRHAELQLAVELDVVGPLGSNANLLFLLQVKRLAELHGHIVAVHLPERREESSALRATAVHAVAQPDFIVARIPYPCTLILHRHIVLWLFAPVSSRVSSVSRSYRPATTPSRGLS